MSKMHFFFAVIASLVLAMPCLAEAPKRAPAEPSAYVGTIDNPWFPMKPGTILVYKGTKDEKQADREFEVMAKTKVVAGVNCIIAEDRVKLGGRPAERTIGYYAQDKAGNVWYFGEQSEELDKNGKVTKSEGWLAGVDGASPNLLMEARPETGDHFAHAFTNGNTEVLKLKASVTVPFGDYPDALQVKDWNPDVPDTVSHKFYVQGIGEVRDVEVKEQSEDLQLVTVKTGG